MIDSIKITSLTNIGANLSYTSIFPVVNVTGTPITNKANLQIIGNYILSQAGSANMVQAAQANLAQAVVNSAQPNITSVGTLTSLTSSGNITAANVNVTGTVYSSGISSTGLASLTILNVSTIANLGAVSNITITGGSNGQVLTTNGNGVLSWSNATTGSYGNSNVVSLMAAFGSNNITTTGNVSVGNIIGNGQALTNIAGANVSGFVPNANVANTAFAVAGANVSGFVPNANVANTAFAVAAANVSGLGNIATINLTGSNANVLYGNGVFAAVAGGANTGNVTFSDQVVMGTGSNDGTGGLYLAPGNASIANSAVQYLRVRGGDVATHIHLDTGNNAYYDQYFGADSRFVKLEANGNVVINADDYNGNGATWTLDTSGNLTLPLNSVVYETNIPDGGLSGSAIALKPAGGTTANQQLLIYPTAFDGDHIHLTSGNLYATELFLGSDNLYVKLANTGNIVINSNDGNSSNAMWTFGTNGALTLPIGVSIDYNGNVQYPKIIADSGKLFSVQGQGNSGSAALAWTVDPNAASQYAAVSVSRGGGDNLAKVVLQAQSDSGNVATAKTWQFSETGNLTLPGNLVIAGNTSVFGTDAALIQTTDNRPLLALSSGANGAVSSLWVEDIGNVGTSNIAAVYANPTSGSKIVRIAVGQNGGNTGPNLWDFGTTGILTLPQGSQISETANTSVNITANANTWAFGVDGNLTIPGSLINDTSIVLSAPAVFNICTIATAGSGYDTGSSLKATTGGSGTGMTVGIGYGLSNQLTSVTVVDPGTGYVNGDVITVSEGTGGTFVITKYNVLANQTNNNTIQTDLTFANNTLTLPVDGNLVGNLIVPGSIVGSGASPAPYISGFSSITLAYGAKIKDTSSDSVSFGQNAGNASQGSQAVAIGLNAGANGQANGAVALGVSAGQLNQGITGIAIGDSAGSSNQGLGAVSIGAAAGFDSQGQYSVAMGYYAGYTSQANNSIILNATGANLNQTTANTFTVAPVRNDTSNIAEVIFYNNTSKEVTYGNTISVAGNITANNFIGNGGSLSNVATSTTGNWTLAPGVNTVSLSVPLNGTYSIWVRGNIPNGIVTYTATAVVTNNNVPVLGSSYGWYYEDGNALVLTSIPTQFVGTVNNISNASIITTTANVFTFGITNNSGTNQVVNWGFTKL